MMPQVAAIIVAFYPDKEKISELIQILHSQVYHVFIIDNGSPADICLAIKRFENVSWLPMSKNLGIGAALNIGLCHAVAMRCSHIITFDQDSSPAANMVERLLAAMEELSAKGYKVAAVGPSYVDLRQTPPMYYPFYRKSGWHVKRIYSAEGSGLIEVDALITSGCLFSVDIFDKVKQFDENFFVDYIDTDWCFMARSLGFSLFGVFDATMSHELGAGKSRNFAGIRLIEYSPLRRYYYYRNTLLFVRRSYVSWFWKIKLTFGLLFRVILLPISPGAKKRQQLGMMFKGCVHGIIGVKGQI